MEHSMNNFKGPEKITPHVIDVETQSPELIEFEPKFKQHQEDLKYMFGIEVADEHSLSSKEVKDEMYTKILEDFREGKPFSLDYMFEEELLTKEDLIERGIKDMKPQAMDMLRTFKGPRLVSTKNLFINTGILTEEEVASTVIH